MWSSRARMSSASAYLCFESRQKLARLFPPPPLLPVRQPPPPPSPPPPPPAAPQAEARGPSGTHCALPTAELQSMQSMKRHTPPSAHTRSHPSPQPGYLPGDRRRAIRPRRAETVCRACDPCIRKVSVPVGAVKLSDSVIFSRLAKLKPGGWKSTWIENPAASGDASSLLSLVEGCQWVAGNSKFDTCFGGLVDWAEGAEGLDAKPTITGRLALALSSLMLC